MSFEGVIVIGNQIVVIVEFYRKKSVKLNQSLSFECVFVIGNQHVVTVAFYIREVFSNLTN